MKLDFTGQKIIITGATRGIGKAIANTLESLGADLILTGTSLEQVEGLNRIAVEERSARKYFCLDMLNENSVENFCQEIRKMSSICGLVNNAGINRLNPVNEILTEDWNEMIAVNLSGPFNMIREVSAIMMRANYGRIVNIASIFSKISKERRAAYSATKFGLNGLTVGSSNDLARYNILVNTLSPGFVLTDLTRTNLSEIEISQLSDMIPVKRMAEVSDISNVAVFLLSDLNLYLTGQNIVVDGGFTNI